MSALNDKIKDGTITNNDIGEFFNIKQGKGYLSGRRSPIAIYSDFPDWLGNASLMLEFIPDDHYVEMHNGDNDTLWKVGIRGYPSNSLKSYMTHKNLTTAILLSVLKFHEGVSNHV